MHKYFIKENHLKLKKKYYTLTELTQILNISMTTLQRYKRDYQDSIPSIDEGRKQRYPREAIKVFKQIGKENQSRVGRPRKDGKLPNRDPLKVKKVR